jgi:hypothetical protein
MRSSLRPRALVAVAAALGLVVAGIAIADPGPASTTLVSARFYADTLAHSNTHTCTGANNDQITLTDATFTGTASSGDTRLAGPVTIHVHSVYDTTTNIGTLIGDVRIAGTSTPPSQFHADLTAVDVNGTVQGWLGGHVAPGADFMGGVSATFSPTGGFSSSGTPGTIGSGTGTNTAVVTSGNCQKTPSNQPKSADHGHKWDGHNHRGHDHDH